MDWVTTSSILESLQDYESRAAWLRFVEHFRPFVIHFNEKLGLSRQDAEDAAQDTFLTFAESFRKGDYDPALGRLRNWLFTIAYRRAMDSLRRTRRRKESWAAVAARAGLDDQESINEAWERDWKDFVLHFCLQRIKREVKASTYSAFEMTVLQGCTAGEAAEALGLTANNVYVAKHRVLRKLNQLTEEFEEAHDSP